MSLYRLTDPVPTLVAPVMIAAFDGWIDAAGAATACANHLAEKGQVVASFDVDSLNDYRARRPVLDVVDGVLARMQWPDIVLRYAKVAGRDLLVLVGPEPDYKWKQLGIDVLELVLRLGVIEWISLGAIPAAVPHTRPVPVLATASPEAILRDGEQQGPGGVLRVPAAALSAIEMTVAGAGIPAIGYYAQVPHYVGTNAYAPATLALLQHLERRLGITMPLGSLADEAIEQRQRLDAAIAEDDDSREYLGRLESLASEERVPSGDEIASEIERYLRRQTGSGEGGEGGGPREQS
ncbi:MAG TPA: PAC2 family protein [Actinomycetota bacterium]|nr:PAC2 family protein [Actinomycetota bacterium]